MSSMQNITRVPQNRATPRTAYILRLFIRRLTFNLWNDNQYSWFLSMRHNCVKLAIDNLALSGIYLLCSQLSRHTCTPIIKNILFLTKYSKESMGDDWHDLFRPNRNNFMQYHRFLCIVKYLFRKLERK